GFRTRHVATGAIILPAPLQLHRRREAAAAIGMALQTAIAVIGRRVLGRGELVGIVAGDAAEPAQTGAEATARVHLLDLADETALGLISWPLENRPEVREGQPWPKVFIPMTSPQDAPTAIQVTLLADGIS